jgi:hypothetical protein
MGNVLLMSLSTERDAGVELEGVQVNVAMRRRGCQHNGCLIPIGGRQIVNNKPKKVRCGRPHVRRCCLGIFRPLNFQTRDLTFEVSQDSDSPLL